MTKLLRRLHQLSYVRQETEYKLDVMLYSIEWNISQGTNAKRDILSLDQKTYFGINQASNNVTKKHPNPL